MWQAISAASPTEFRNCPPNESARSHPVTSDQSTPSEARENSAGQTVPSSYLYEVNAIGQRTLVGPVLDQNGDPVSTYVVKWNWHYDERGQLEEAEDAGSAGNDRAYAYDSIGNRTKTVDGLLDDLPDDPNWQANNLNQYTSIPFATQAPDHDDNLKTGQLRTIASNGTPTPYNATLVWNADNRLGAVYDNKGNTDPDDDDLIATYKYDYLGRRISKTVGTATTYFIYDGWNLIAEYDSADTSDPSRTYLWGLDLSNTLQGAGGVGGLLAVRIGSATYYPTYDGNGNVSEKPRGAGGVLDRSVATCPAGVSRRAEPANQYLASDGAGAAHFNRSEAEMDNPQGCPEGGEAVKYDPFGKLVVVTGDEEVEDDQGNVVAHIPSVDFAHRFSTKYFDSETGLYDYGRRHYDPPTGRWISRDPIGERGGVNLYGFVGNDGVGRYDLLGLVIITIADTSIYKDSIKPHRPPIPLPGQPGFGGEIQEFHGQGTMVIPEKKGARSAFLMKFSYTLQASCSNGMPDGIMIIDKNVDTGTITGTVGAQTTLCGGGFKGNTEGDIRLKTGKLTKCDKTKWIGFKAHVMRVQIIVDVRKVGKIFGNVGFGVGAEAESKPLVTVEMATHIVNVDVSCCCGNAKISEIDHWQRNYEGELKPIDRDFKK